jgi:hypothetical protein
VDNLNPILIQGSQEPAAVVGDAVKEYVCGCGNKIKVNDGVVISGPAMEVVTGKSILCPICNGAIDL